MKKGLIGGLLSLCIVGFFDASHTNAETTPSIKDAPVCGVAAMTAHNKAVLALDLEESMPSIEGTIKRRRLDEQYCLEFAKCTLAAMKPPESLARTVIATEFSSCLHDEESDDAQ